YELFRNIKNKDDETYKIMHEASQWLAMALDSSMDAICNDKETILIPDVDPRSNYLAHKVVDVDTLAETLTGLVNEEEIERNIFSEISSFCNISDKHILDSAKEYLKKYLNEHIRLIDSEMMSHRKDEKKEAINKFIKVLSNDDDFSSLSYNNLKNLLSRRTGNLIKAFKPIIPEVINTLERQKEDLSPKSSSYLFSAFSAMSSMSSSVSDEPPNQPST
ncbi:hypothetical protein L3V83_15760, partial [Thiotrichales bacterium 19X7-9]|nr:hypothetical protein [Thiotrichales bacterium 19X7-9]